MKEITGNGNQCSVPREYLCPKCKQPLQEIRYPSDSMLNRDQWESQLPGDLFCTHHNNHKGNKPYAYFWKSALAESPSESAPAPEGGDERAKELSDLLCPVHANLDKNDHLEPFDNCIACIRNERDELRKAIAAERKISDGCRADASRLGEILERAKFPAPGGHDLAMYLALKLPDSLNLHTSAREPLRKVIYELLCKFYSGGNRTFDPIHEVRKLREKYRRC